MRWLSIRSYIPATSLTVTNAPLAHSPFPSPMGKGLRRNRGWGTTTCVWRRLIGPSCPLDASHPCGLERSTGPFARRPSARGRARPFCCACRWVQKDQVEWPTASHAPLVHSGVHVYSKPEVGRGPSDVFDVNVAMVARHPSCQTLLARPPYPLQAPRQPRRLLPHRTRCASCALPSEHRPDGQPPFGNPM
jgi:hypothetical protein